MAFALSAGIAGVAGGIHAMYVGYVTVGETFSITVPLYVVLMSVLGGARHWLGPAVGATLIASSLYAFTGGQQAVLGRAAVALVLVLVILILPEGVVPAILRRRRPSMPAVEPAPALESHDAVAGEPAATPGGRWWLDVWRRSAASGPARCEPAGGAGRIVGSWDRTARADGADQRHQRPLPDRPRPHRWAR